MSSSRLENTSIVQFGAGETRFGAVARTAVRISAALNKGLQSPRPADALIVGSQVSLERCRFLRGRECGSHPQGVRAGSNRRGRQASVPAASRVGAKQIETGLWQEWSKADTRADRYLAPSANGLLRLFECVEDGVWIGRSGECVGVLIRTV
jgi:hypothetical protein